MKPHALLAVALTTAVLASPTFAQTPTTAPATRPAAAADGRVIEICFVLDTTGSMSGLIDGAKAKIWSIANAIVRREPGATLRVALVGYRDRGDEYVTRRHDLTDDLDAVFKDLQAFAAGGGGDGPESVNEALREAVEKIAWTPGDAATRIVFLVGDAPPHMDYDDDVKYPDTCKAAVAKGVIINAVQCGDDGTTTPVWQEIARSAEGSFVQLAQDGNVQVVETPMDAELAELNRQVGTTIVAYGGAGGAGGGGGLFASSRPAEEVAAVGRDLAAKQAASEAAPASVAADRAEFNLASGKVVQGEGELLDALKAGSVKLQDLKDEQLPDDLRKLAPAERQARVDELQRRRTELQARIAELTTKRAAYLAEEAKERDAVAEGDAFDTRVSEIVAEQTTRE